MLRVRYAFAVPLLSVIACAAPLPPASTPNGQPAIEASVRASHRLPANAARDRYRHPAETLAFFGVQPTMTVLDIDPGAGWYTELLAPMLAKEGTYLTTATHVVPDSHSESHWSTRASKDFAALLASAPDLYGKVQTIVVDYEKPKLGLEGTVDMVLMMREVHMMRNWGTLDAWLHESYRALKPGGVLGIVDHRAPPDAAPEACARTGYLPEAWVIAKVEAAGFKLVGKSEINANPSDTKDYEKGVWTLPPEFALEAKDHDRYAAIGESDRMTLKFVKGP